MLVQNSRNLVKPRARSSSGSCFVLEECVIFLVNYVHDESESHRSKSNIRDLENKNS